MATAYIREYSALAMKGAVQAGDEPAVTDQTVTTSAASAQSAAFDANTRFIAISSPAAQAVSVLFGLNPTATTVNFRIPAGQIMFFGVRPGYKAALIDVT